MIRTNVQDAKTHLSRFLEQVERGETVVICRRNVPIAELRPIEQARRTARPVGLERDRFTVPRTFFEPLPAELEDAFAGR
jgi:prevent-host-death family protein